MVLTGSVPPRPSSEGADADDTASCELVKGEIKEIVAHDHVQGLRIKLKLGLNYAQLVTISGKKCILQDLIFSLCISKGAGGLSGDHLLFPMTWTDFENCLTVEADCTCIRRLLLEIRRLVSQVNIISTACHRTKGRYRWVIDSCLSA